MQVVVDSLITHYEIRGKGPTLLLLHGWADSLAGMSKLVVELSEDLQVIALDLPGFGDTEAPKDVWGLDDYIQFIAAFLDKIQAPKLRAVVGHSNGGAMAIRGLSRGVLSSDKLVLLASAGIRGEHEGRLQAIKLITKTGKLLAAPLPKSIKRKLRGHLYKAVGSDMLVAEHLEQTFKRVVGEDVRADAANVNTPTLLIYGENDDQTPVAYGEILHQLITPSTLEILPNTGHFVHNDQTQKVTSAIKGFVA